MMSLNLLRLKALFTDERGGPCEVRKLTGPRVIRVTLSKPTIVERTTIYDTALVVSRDRTAATAAVIVPCAKTA